VALRLTRVATIWSFLATPMATTPL
jgi:hypothetical protein